MINNPVKIESMESKVTATERCGECGQTNVLTGSQVFYQMPQTVDGRTLYVTSYSCFSCKSINVVQVDDDETKKLLKRLKKLVARQMQRNELGGDYTSKDRKLSVKARRLQDELEEKRKALLAEYRGE